MLDPIATAHNDTVGQAAQRAEADARAATNAVAPGETAIATEGSDIHGEPHSPGAKPEPQQTTEPVAPAPRPDPRSPSDKMRAEINARFREARSAPPTEADDSISAFAREAMPPEFTQAAEPELEPEPQPNIAPEPRQAAPQTVRVKVNGKEMDLPLDEVIANAQKALASEDILERAKNKAREIDVIVDQARQNAQRAGRDGHHADPNGSQTETPPEGVDAANQGAQRPLVEEIQFGDPVEAEARLQDTIAKRTDAAVQEALIQERLRNEGARGAKVLKDFTDKHPELASDQMAVAAIEATTLKLQTEDLKAIGLDPNQIRRDGQPATPADIAQAHRWYRANGVTVRSPEALLQEATTQFLDWKGVAKKEPTVDPAAPKAPPRIEVTVDRNERRNTVAQQPSRTTAPKQAQPPAAPRDRSSVVDQMKARNAKLRGSTLSA